MALIECKECGQQISDSAAVCPNCGCKTALGIASAKLKGTMVRSIINIGVMLAGGIMFLSGFSTLMDNMDRFSKWLKNGDSLSTFILLGVGIGLVIGAGVDMRKQKYEAQWYANNSTPPAQDDKTTSTLYCEMTTASEAGYWSCTCGRKNASFVSSCCCGKNKRDL